MVSEDGNETGWPPGYREAHDGGGHAPWWWVHADGREQDGTCDSPDDARLDAWADHARRRHAGAPASNEAWTQMVRGDKHDPVESPSHYTDGGEEFTDGEEARMTAEQFEGAMLFNARKYLRRAGKKGPISEDLRKARWYIDRLIANVEESKNG